MTPSSSQTAFPSPEVRVASPSIARFGGSLHIETLLAIPIWCFPVFRSMMRPTSDIMEFDEQDSCTSQSSSSLLFLQVSGRHQFPNIKETTSRWQPDSMTRAPVAYPSLLLEVLVDTFARYTMGIESISFFSTYYSVWCHTARTNRIFRQPCHCPCNDVWR